MIARILIRLGLAALVLPVLALPIPVLPAVVVGCAARLAINLPGHPAGGLPSLARTPAHRPGRHNRR